MRGDELDSVRIQCVGCDLRFVAQYSGQKYHSKDCATKARRLRRLRKKGHKPVRVGISWNCKHNRHSICTSKHCTCNCGHPVGR